MARVNVQLDNYSLQSDAVVASYIGHDGGPRQALNLLKISRRDGEKLISSTFEPKTLSISGVIKGSDQDDLERNIDEFKRYTAVTQGELDIEYAGGYRRYIVALQTVLIERAFHHITRAPFSLTFIVNDPPFGQKVSGLGGELVVNEAMSAQAIASVAYQTTITFDGSAPPKPVITAVIDTVGSLAELTFKNQTTNQEITVGTSWSNGDQVTIDTDGNTVRRAGIDVDFEGIFPEFDLGPNQILLTLSDSGSLDQQQVLQDSDAETQGSYIEEAQTFQVSASTNYDKIEALIKKTVDFDNDTQTEGFDSTTNKDAGNTTGDWNTGASAALLANTGVATSNIDALSGGGGGSGLQVPSTDFGGGELNDFTKMAQSFVPTVSSLLPQVKISAKKVNSPTGLLVVTIQTNSGNKPSGTILASTTVDVSAWSTSFADRTITFSSPPALASGTTYWLVLDASGSGFSKNNQIAWDSAVTSYSSGNGVGNRIINGITEVWDQFLDGSGSLDFAFQTYYYPLTAASNIIQSTGIDTGNVTNTFVSGTTTATLNGCTVTTEWSDSADNSSFGSWTQNITELSRRYVRFRLTITGGSATASAFITSIAFAYKSKVRLTLYNTSGGLPTTEITTVNVNGDTVGLSYAFTAFTFAAAQALTAGTTYAVSIRPTSLTGRIAWGYKNADVYSLGQRVRRTSSAGSWSALSTNDFAFKVYKTQTVNWSVDLKVGYTERYM